MDDLDQMERGRQDEDGNQIPLIVMREDEDEPHRKTFYKVVDIFGDKLEKRPSVLAALRGPQDEPDNVDTTKNKINLKKLNSVIERLENPINPLSVMNKSNRVTMVRRRVVDLDVEEDGYWNEDEFLQLAKKEDPDMTERKILDYVQKIADAKKLLKWPPPWFSLILTTVHLILFLVTSYDQEGTGKEIIKALEFDTDFRSQPWRYVTYSLVHLDSSHIISNMLLQMFTACLLEMRHGPWRVFVLFFTGVISSSLAYYTFDDSILLGSSGGVYCLVASSFCTTIFNWNEDEVVLINRLDDTKTPHAFGGKLVRLLKLVLILLFTSFDFGSALYRRFVSQEDSGTSVIAHAFGFLAGFLFGFTLLRNERTEKWETVLKFTCLAIFLLLFIAGLGINIAGYRGLVGCLSLV